VVVVVELAIKKMLLKLIQLQGRWCESDRNRVSDKRTTQETQLGDRERECVCVVGAGINMNQKRKWKGDAPLAFNLLGRDDRAE
jgi:hypothetical protein